jgi:hypothetical protein
MLYAIYALGAVQTMLDTNVGCLGMRHMKQADPVV